MGAAHSRREKGTRILPSLPQGKLRGHREPERDAEDGSAGNETQLGRIPGVARLRLQHQQRRKHQEKHDGGKSDAVEQTSADCRGGVIDVRQVRACLPVQVVRYVYRNERRSQATLFWP